LWRLEGQGQKFANNDRISRKIKNVAEVSKVPLKIQNNSRTSKSLAENLNLQANVGRSAGYLKLQRNK
jgi:hypothetical protein